MSKIYNRQILQIPMVFIIAVFPLLVGCRSAAIDSAFEQYGETMELAPVSVAQTPDLPEKSGLRELIEYASVNNPGLRASHSKWKSKLHDAARAGVLPDPMLKYGNFIESVETRVGSQKNKYGISQKFPFFGKLKLKEVVAIKKAEVEAKIYESNRWKIARDVAEVYYELYYLEKAIEKTKENMILLTRMEQTAQTLFKAGKAQNQDVLKVQVELGRLENEILSLQDMKNPLLARLGSLLDLNVTKLQSLDYELPKEPQIKESEILKLIEQQNPDILISSARIDVSEQALKLSRKSYYPDFTLGVETVDTRRISMAVQDNGKDPWVVSLGLNIPIWVGARDEEVRSTLELKRKATMDELDTRNRVKSRAELVLYKLRDAARQRDLYEKSLIPKALQALMASENAFSAGKVEFLNLLDGQRTLLIFQLAETRAVTNYYQKAADIEMLLGMSLSDVEKILEGDGK